MRCNSKNLNSKNFVKAENTLKNIFLTFKKIHNFMLGIGGFINNAGIALFPHNHIKFAADNFSRKKLQPRRMRVI